MAEKSKKGKKSVIDYVISKPWHFLAMFVVLALLIGAIVYLVSPKGHTNPYRTDYPEIRTTKVGSYVFSVPGIWQIGGNYSYYKDFYIDSSSRLNYSRVCYAKIEPEEEITLDEFAEQFWNNIEEDWQISNGKVKYSPIEICDTKGISLEYSGNVPGRNTNGEILVLEDLENDGFVLLTYERVGAASSASKDFQKVKDSLHLYEGSEEITRDPWHDLNADTLDNYHFDYAMTEYTAATANGIYDPWNVYIYDLSDEIIFFFTETREEPHHVEASWNPDNLLIYRYVGDPDTGAIAILPSSNYPDLVPTTRDWFIKGKVHWAKGHQLYDTCYEVDPQEKIDQFQREFGAYAF
ncbi:MAG: hypothetical protein IJ091_09000 [Oscillospiraceae bacterium]|nr:hypothetical protein [Oscillospiraceae bacterium]